MVISNNNQKGFTLVELLLYLALSAIILTASSLFIQLVLEARIKNRAIREVDQQGQLALEVISRAIANAETVTTPATGASASSLTLTSLTPSISPTVINDVAGVLHIQEGASTAVPLTNSRVTVSGLTFTNLSRASTPGIVRVTFTISTTNPSGRGESSFTRSFTTSISLR